MGNVRATGPITAALFAALACSSGPEVLMETPVLYEGGAISPFEHLAPEQRTPELDVFFATDRERVDGPESGVSYGTGVADSTRLGHASIRFGQDLSWSELEAASLGQREEQAPITLELGHVHELGLLGPREDARAAPEEHGHAAFAEMLDARIAESRDPDVIVYVHGAKVDFYRCVARSAEFAHFAGRDFATVVFDWPSHPQIFSYVFGGDVGRAKRSSVSLAHLLELIAHDTSARRVHILAYSAGATVATHALSDLRRSHAALTPKQLREELRIGAVVIAAGDIEVQEFLELAGDLNDVAERVCVLSSDADNVLRMAEDFMGGGERLGELRPEEIGALGAFEHLEVVDVSGGKAARGFDVGGHHYWYRHPWISSDMILNLRADLPPEERGLAPGGAARVWELPADYPERARDAALEASSDAWPLRPAAER